MPADDVNTNDMTRFLTSNYIKAEDLDPNVLIESGITSVQRAEFEEHGEVIVKPVVRLEDGRGIVLNQTRLRVLIGAFGPNAANWLGKQLIVRRGKTHFQGRSVAAVEIEPVLAPRIEGPSPQAVPAIEKPRTGSSTAPAGPAAEPAHESEAQSPRGKATIVSGGQKSADDRSVMDELRQQRPDLKRYLDDDLNDAPV
jgi:hypothetical protein